MLIGLQPEYQGQNCLWEYNGQTDTKYHVRANRAHKGANIWLYNQFVKI